LAFVPRRAHSRGRSTFPTRRSSDLVEAGTDPYDASSYPKPVPPQLILGTASDQLVYVDTLTVSGQVLAGDLPLARVSVTDASGTRLISLNANRFFTIDLSLAEGSNHFRFVVTDVQGYSASADLHVIYIVPFQINSVTP